MAPNHQLCPVMGRASVDEVGKREQANELRNHPFRVPALFLEGFGQTEGTVTREVQTDPAESKNPCKRGRFTLENRERLGDALRCRGPAEEGLWPNAQHARPEVLRHRHSTEDPAEQSHPVGCGGGGGKGW